MNLLWKKYDFAVNSDVQHCGKEKWQRDTSEMRKLFPPTLMGKLCLCRKHKAYAVLTFFSQWGLMVQIKRPTMLLKGNLIYAKEHQGFFVIYLRIRSFLPSYSYVLVLFSRTSGKCGSFKKKWERTEDSIEKMLSVYRTLPHQFRALSSLLISMFSRDLKRVENFASHENVKRALIKVFMFS